MLHEFLSSNRDELIKRCREKVSQRDSPPPSSSELDHGVPLVLGQLIEALRHDQANPASKPDGRSDSPGKTPGSLESSRSAALHGKGLLDEGYTVDQVVHDYGDICQAVTELARERNAPVTVDEFHTLNRLLDKAIADAVSSYGHHRDESIVAQGDQGLHDRMGALAEKQRQLLDTALKALDALKVGNIGVLGATGTVMHDSLVKLRELIDKSLPEIRLSSGMTVAANGKARA